MKPPICLLAAIALVSAAVVTFRWAAGADIAPSGDSADRAALASRRPSAAGRQSPKPGSRKAVKAFMRQKLGAMRQVMRGIVTEDYDLIETNARRMQKMGTQVEWNIVQGPIYGDYSESFRRSAELLATAAKEKNADAAMLVYMQVTLNCIDCHRYTRGPKVKWKFRME